MISHDYPLNNLTTNNFYLETPAGKLTHSELRILLTILKHRNTISYICIPGMRKISEQTGCSHTTIVKGVSALKSKGFISVTKNRHGYNGGRANNFYWFNHDIGIVHSAFSDYETNSFFETHHTITYDAYISEFGDPC